MHYNVESQRRISNDSGASATTFWVEQVVQDKEQLVSRQELQVAGSSSACSLLQLLISKHKMQSCWLSIIFLKINSWMKLQIQRQSWGYAWQRKALGQVVNDHSWESGPNVQRFDCSWLYPWLLQPANTYNWVDTTYVQKLKPLWVLWTSWNHVCRWNWNKNLELLKRNFQKKRNFWKYSWRNIDVLFWKGRNASLLWCWKTLKWIIEYNTVY